MARSGIARMAWPTITATLTSSLAAIVNFATEWKTSVWAWIIAATLTVLSGAMSHILQKPQDERGDTTPSAGFNDINIRGSVQMEHGRIRGLRNRWRSGTLRANTIVFEAGVPPSIDPQQADSEPSPDSPRYIDSHREHEN